MKRLKRTGGASDAHQQSAAEQNEVAGGALQLPARYLEQAPSTSGSSVETNWAAPAEPTGWPYNPQTGNYYGGSFNGSMSGSQNFEPHQAAAMGPAGFPSQWNGESRSDMMIPMSMESSDLPYTWSHETTWGSQQYHTGGAAYADISPMPISGVASAEFANLMSVESNYLTFDLHEQYSEPRSMHYERGEPVSAAHNGYMSADRPALYNPRPSEPSFWLTGYQGFEQQPADSIRSGALSEFFAPQSVERSRFSSSAQVLREPFLQPRRVGSESVEVSASNRSEGALIASRAPSDQNSAVSAMVAAQIEQPEQRRETDSAAKAHTLVGYQYLAENQQNAEKVNSCSQEDSENRMFYEKEFEPTLETGSSMNPEPIDLIDVLEESSDDFSIALENSDKSEETGGEWASEDNLPLSNNLNPPLLGEDSSDESTARERREQSIEEDSDDSPSILSQMFRDLENIEEENGVEEDNSTTPFEGNKNNFMDFVREQVDLSLEAIRRRVPGIGKEISQSEDTDSTVIHSSNSGQGKAGAYKEAIAAEQEDPVKAARIEEIKNYLLNEACGSLKLMPAPAKNPSTMRRTPKKALVRMEEPPSEVVQFSDDESDSEDEDFFVENHANEEEKEATEELEMKVAAAGKQPKVALRYGGKDLSLLRDRVPASNSETSSYDESDEYEESSTSPETSTEKSDSTSDGEEELSSSSDGEDSESSSIARVPKKLKRKRSSDGEDRTRKSPRIEEDERVEENSTPRVENDPMQEAQVPQSEENSDDDSPDLMQSEYRHLLNLNNEELDELFRDVPEIDVTGIRRLDVSSYDRLANVMFTFTPNYEEIINWQLGSLKQATRSGVQEAILSNYLFSVTPREIDRGFKEAWSKMMRARLIRKTGLKGRRGALIYELTPQNLQPPEEAEQN